MDIAGVVGGVRIFGAVGFVSVPANCAMRATHHTDKS